MHAIIMAGGEGTRLKSVTGDTPKPLALLAGKPLLDRILYWLAHCGVDRACLALRYRPELFQQRYADGSRFGLELHCHEEREALGTAGAVRSCGEFLQGEDTLVVSGDAACDFDLGRLMEVHRRSGAWVTMALYSVKNPLAYGTVLMDREGRVLRFLEKPDWSHVLSDLVNTGIYALRPEALAAVPRGEPCDFACDLFPRLLQEGRPILGLPMEGYWCDIGTPKAYHRCNLDALEGKLRLYGPETEQERAPSPRREQEAALPASRELPCRNRARLMRLLAAPLMEAGADFELGDGLRLRNSAGSVRVNPAADRESLLLRTEGRGGDDLERQCETLLRRLERESEETDAAPAPVSEGAPLRGPGSRQN